MTPENTTVYSYDNPSDFTIEYDGRVYTIPAGSRVTLTTTMVSASATVSDSATFTYTPFRDEH